MPISGSAAGDIPIPAVMVTWEARQLLMSMRGATNAVITLQKTSGMCASEDASTESYKPILPAKS